MSSLRSTFSKNVKKLRSKRKITQEEFAQPGVVDYKYLQRIEGKNPPNLKLDTIERIAKALKVPPSKLFEA
ncbi:MAG TPA: helix-turn-helix transcriptional regulator [Candidatus Omnitrophota bacterium]|nr:helix-turn-helix transcriptional regulator [Candidatus Omnitrophota bacterium]